MQQHAEEKAKGVRRVAEYVQPTAEAGYMGRFTQSSEHTSEDMQRRHPEIKKQLESKVFDTAQVASPPHVSRPRVRQIPDDVLHSLQPPPNTRKDEAAARIGNGPSMVERMLNCNYPMSHPAHNEFLGHRNQPDFAKKRNESQIAIGGYHSLPAEPFKANPGSRRSVQVDYSSFIPDRIQAKRFYAIDGRMVDGQQGVPIVKNFFSDEPLLCSKWVSDNGPSLSPRIVEGPAAQSIPEPPHRRAPFDHGPRSFM